MISLIDIHIHSWIDASVVLYDILGTSHISSRLLKSMRGCCYQPQAMWYFRFLQTPSVTIFNDQADIKALVTLTTDLGECFYPASLQILVELQSGTATFTCDPLRWRPGMRALPIVLAIAASKLNKPRIASLHVAVASGLSFGSQDPRCIDVYSLPFALVDGMRAERRVERRFRYREKGSWREIQIREDMGESIARHIWSVWS